MRSSAEQPIVGSIPDVHDLPWAQLMGNALGHVVRSVVQTSGRRPDSARERPAERISAFNNYI